MEVFQGVISNVSSYFTNLYITKNYLQAGIIVGLIFALLLILAQVRRHFVHGSLKGGVAGLVFGILLTLVIEGFLIVHGHTALTSILSWNNAPKPISTALDLGKEKLTEVLGVEVEVKPTTTDVISVMQSLNPSEMQKIKAIICTP